MDLKTEFPFPIDCFLSLNTSEEGNYNVTLGGDLTLFCVTEENSTVWWETNGTIVQTGSFLVLDQAHLANSSLYSCVVNTSECSRQLDFNISVLEPVWGWYLLLMLVENEKSFFDSYLRSCFSFIFHELTFFINSLFNSFNTKLYFHYFCDFSSLLL